MQILSPEEIPLMRSACRLAARLLEYIEPYIQPGVTTNRLDQLCYEYILDHKATPAPLGYMGFPKSICTSVNDCICHGVPDTRPLQEGDMVNVDVTCIKEGFHGDTSKTFFVGEVSQRVKDLTNCAFQAMQKGIEAIKPHGTTGDIGFAVGRFVTRQGFFPVREIGGHGIGKKFHDDPFVPSVGKKGKGDILPPWSCITVEPMVNELSEGIRELSIPGSSVKYYHTVDQGLSAQFEHTVLVRDGAEGVNYEILTARDPHFN
ncbi:MAG: type I methionyl aminopeptidase [Bdellovibrionales bacterium]|nr:type I methionyl aminopeptidase [Bdellovibrionales bacterium]